MDWKIEGRSPLVTPPGTTAAVAGAAVGVTTGAAPAPPEPTGGAALDVATWPAPGSGEASGMSSGASVGPPGMATIATWTSARDSVSRFVG